jgi:hypothetical protein
VDLGIVGRGYWGNTYASVLKSLDISFWQAGRDWKKYPIPDGLIIASSSDSHYEVAKEALAREIPVLIEKPVCMKSSQAEVLIAMGGIAFAGHTRLYAPEWQAFKDRVGVPKHVSAFAGGVNASNPDPLLNWWVHLAAMCHDLGFHPDKASFSVTTEKRPLKFIADGEVFEDGKPGALANLVGEFVKAIESGVPDNRGLQLGLKTLQYVEKQCLSQTTRR